MTSTRIAPSCGRILANGLHYYFYFIDAELSLIYLRVPTPALAGAGSGARSVCSSIAMGIAGWPANSPPLLVDEHGEIISGEARVDAAILLELTSVPVIVAKGWSQEEKRAYRIADNQLAARASWDPNLLRDELRALDFADFDLGLIGFEPDQLETILAGLGSSGLTAAATAPAHRMSGQC